MPIQAKSRPQPRGLTVLEHQFLAHRLQRLVRDLVAIRDSVHVALGRAHEGYGAAEAAVGEVRRVCVALCEALPAAGVDPATVAEVRAMYLEAR